MAHDLDQDEIPPTLVVSMDAKSRLMGGDEGHFWLDTRLVHVFDPETGENLTRDAEAGRKLLRLVDALEDNEDVQQVHSNFDLPEELLAEME